MAWAEEKAYNQSGGGPFMGLIRKEGSTGNDPHTWSAARVVNQGAFPNVGFGAGEMFSSPMGTNVEMRMEPEWYAQRGQPFMNQQIGTDEILDLYNEDENYSGGGIASTRPGYAWAGPVTKDQGFDTRGGEQLWQANTGYDWSKARGEGNLPANELIELGLSASPEGALSGVDETPTNLEEEDRSWWDPRGWKFWNRGGIASLENRPGYAWAGVVDQNAPPQNWISKKPSTNDWSEWVNKESFASLPSQEGNWISKKPDYRDLHPDYQSFITKKVDKEPISNISDFYGQFLEDEESQWIQRKAEGGGIASLENRPGYKWGGFEPGKEYSWRELTSSRPSGDWNVPGSGGEAILNRMDLTRPGRDSVFGRSNPFFFDRSGTMVGPNVSEKDLYTDVGGGNLAWDPRKKDEYGFTTNPLYGEDARDYQIVPFGNITSDKSFYTPDFPWMNEGGAVGLEPGIASLMGYAKGGMVTKVKVPKGQSKWMKKFMNSMRDN